MIATAVDGSCERVHNARPGLINKQPQIMERKKQAGKLRLKM